MNNERLIPHLRRDFYIGLDESMGGDAPKDFVRVYCYGEARKAKPHKWPAYIAKVGHKWYPGESITEHLLTRIGATFGFNVTPSRLARIDNQIRFLSRYFLKSEESLVHGKEIFAQYVRSSELVTEIDDGRLAHEMFTFQFICDALIDAFGDLADGLIDDFVRLLAFDALTGNNDRHHLNWGVVTHARHLHPPVFAPIYDSARALFWNFDEQKLLDWNVSEEKRRRKINKYVKGARPQTGWEGIELKNHFDLMGCISNCDSGFKAILQSYCDPGLLTQVVEMVNTEFGSLMSDLRRAMISDCLTLRFKLYCEAVS